MLEILIRQLSFRSEMTKQTVFWKSYDIGGLSSSKQILEERQRVKQGVQYRLLWNLHLFTFFSNSK